jgi:lysophospholipid acyltransferase (LPLAT)-like uncharacterized protein
LLGRDYVKILLNWLCRNFPVFALADFDTALRIGHSARAMAFSLAFIKRDRGFLWFWRMISPAVAIFMYVDAKLTLLTSTVTPQGTGASYAGPAIYANWHKYVPFLCIHYGQRRFWLLMSSAPYLEPVAMWCRWMGLTVVRSAPGERSRESLGHLIEALKNGQSVALAADGPAGPGFQAKSGCIDLARAARVPIIPVACRSRKGKSNLKRWDLLYSVRKFDQIEVCYGPPIFLDPSEPDSTALARVQGGLTQLEELNSPTWPFLSKSGAAHSSP